MGRFHVRARHPSPVDELFPVRHHRRPALTWATVQRTKEPLHAAYLNTPSLETRNPQSLLSSSSTSARHSATYGYATQSWPCSLLFSAPACMQLQGWYPCRQTWDFRSELTEKNSVIQRQVNAFPQSPLQVLCTTNSAQPPRSSDLETKISHVILKLLHLMAAQDHLASRLQLHHLETTPSRILQAKGTNLKTVPIG